jgi:hypothetical protein
MPANYVLIERITLNATATSVVLDNIPQTGYTDLKVVWSARGTDNTSYNYITFNSGVGSGRLLYAETSGSTVASFTQTVIQPISSQSYPTVTANTFANCEMYIPNYSVAGVAKSVSVDGVTGSAASSGVLGMHSYITATTSAINTITIKQGGSTDTGNFLVGSSFSIYGIAALGTTPTVVPKASGGDIVVNDGTYWYHAFLSSGTFTPSSNLTCDYLVVAGGGGAQSGGGGAGGYRTSLNASPLALTAQNYSVTIGAGGAGAWSNVNQPSVPTSGSNSVFSTITSAGGGGGYGSGVAGGSGGGNGKDANTFVGAAGNTPSVSPSQGNAGGYTPGTYPNPGGSGWGGAGGGGASAAGTNGGPYEAPGNGGNGSNSTSAFASATGTGASGYYAGGGGGAGSGGQGGTGGSGGGGVGGSSSAAGIVNTGGGGGGSYYSQGIGKAGGSGIVIVRYTMA